VQGSTGRNCSKPLPTQAPGSGRSALSGRPQLDRIVAALGSSENGKQHRAGCQSSRRAAITCPRTLEPKDPPTDVGESSCRPTYSVSRTLREGEVSRPGAHIQRSVVKFAARLEPPARDSSRAAGQRSRPGQRRGNPAGERAGIARLRLRVNALRCPLGLTPCCTPKSYPSVTARTLHGGPFGS
jgi:hypothetical protein